MKQHILTAAVVVLCTCSSSHAQDAFVRPQVQAVCVQAAPTIDGSLDDACWQQVQVFSDFKEWHHGSDAPETTRVRLCCDSDTLYAAFECLDSHPQRILAEQTQRGCGMGKDDHVKLLLDTLNTQLSYYEFAVNPIGTQSQCIPTGAADNITWRGDWQAAAQTTQTGWCAEMAIPFAGLRYPSGADTFGIAFCRYSPAYDKEWVYPNLGPNYDLARFASLNGLDLPRQAGRPVVMPYVVASTEPDRTFTQWGLDYKQELPDSVIAMATVNPDFTDVQDSVETISYSYYKERYRSEYRPFFQEGSELFPDRTAFYSRRIEDVDVGIKTFGEVGKHSFAFLDALTFGEENHFAASYNYDATRDSGLGIYITGSDVKDAYKADPLEPDASYCVSPGGFLRWRADSGTTTLTCRQYASKNSDGTPDGSFFQTTLVKEAAAGHLGYSIQHDRIDGSYYVRDAYVPLSGIRGTFLKVDYFDRPADGRLTYWDVYATASRYYDETDDSVYYDSADLGISCETSSEWRVGAYFATGSWLGDTDSTALLQCAWKSRHLYGGGSFGYLVGKRAGLDYQEGWLDQSFRITPKLSMLVGYELTKLDGPFGSDTNSQFTVSGNYDISPERTATLWAVGRESDLNVSFTYRQTVRSGSDIYLIYGYPNTLTTQQRFAVKVVTPITW